MRGHHAAYEDQSTGARAGAGSATQQATRKLSTIGHFGVSEFAAYLCTKRIHPADSLGFGNDILFDGEARRPFAFPTPLVSASATHVPVGSTDALQRFDARRAPEER